MDAITQLNYSNPVSGNKLPGVDASKSKMTLLAASSRQSLGITFTTTENDRVALNSSSSATAAYASYEKDGTIALAASLVRTQELSLSVAGVLGKDEIVDIAQAMHTVGKVTKDVANGRMQAAEAHARKLDRLDQISSIAISYSSGQTVVAATQSASVEFVA